MLDDGKLFSKIVYSRLVHIRVGDGALLPVSHIGHTVVGTHKLLLWVHLSDCTLSKFLTFLIFAIVFFPLNNFVKTIV